MHREPTNSGCGTVAWPSNLPKIPLAATIGSAALTGVSVALGFTVFDNADSARYGIPAAVLTLGAFPSIAGWLLPEIRAFALFPISTLVSLSVASFIDGPLSSDSEPIAFVILLTMIYGGMATLAFLLGCIVRQSCLAVRRKQAATERQMRMCGRQRG